MDQHVSGFRLGQAAGPEVEKGVLVELTDRRAVRTLHVVSENFELRLRVDERSVGEQQRAVRLLGIRLLGVLPDDDLAVEHRPRRPPEDALVDLMARAVRLRMVDRRVVVDEPLAVCEVEPVQRDLGTLTVERGYGVVAHQLPAQ